MVPHSVYVGVWVGESNQTTAWVSVPLSYFIFWRQYPNEVRIGVVVIFGLDATVVFDTTAYEVGLTL